MDVFEVFALRGTRKILKALSSKQELKYSELVEIVGFSKTTSRALRGMEKLGLVQKRALSEPYRPVAYWLTPKGKRLAALVEEVESVI